MEEAKERVSRIEYDKVIFNDKVLELEPKKSKKEKISAVATGFALGLVVGWIIFDDFFIGYYMELF